jgi:hypothetical protein
VINNGPRSRVAYVDARMAELDRHRLADAVDALLIDHRRRGSAAEALLARGAWIVVKPASRGRIEVRLGWLDEWPAQKVHGHGMTLGFLALAELSVSTARGCRST